MVTLHTTCRICHSSDLVPGLTIEAPLVTAFPHRGDDIDQLPRVPLEVDLCNNCGLAQLRQSCSPDMLYEEYWYESGVNERMREELARVAVAASERAELFERDAVLDIGANDGTLLDLFSSRLFKVGVDASPQFIGQLCHATDSAICGIFPDCSAHIPLFPYKVITSIAMFNHVNNPVEFAGEIRRLLHPRGVWVCQFQDFTSQVQDGVWDNFVHEHVTYPTLTDMVHVANATGLQVFDAETTPINGGSLRVYLGHAGAFAMRPAVLNLAARDQRVLRSREETAGVMSEYRQKIHHNISQIRYFVESITADDKVVDLYGASTKGNTLLQATGVSQMIRAAWERNPRKFGRTTVTGVPIIDEELGRLEPPDTLLATIWQFKHGIIQRERETLKQARLILPLPDATLIERMPA